LLIHDSTKNPLCLPLLRRTSERTLFSPNELRERLSVSRRVAQKFDLRKLDDAEVKEQYQVKITNRFAALENFDDNVDMNRAWENVRENIRDSAKGGVGHYVLHQHLGLMMNVQI
jgi:phosphoglycolate phosphatase-like HAD superfamily hydrolase